MRTVKALGHFNIDIYIYMYIYNKQYNLRTSRTDVRVLDSIMFPDLFFFLL